MKREKIFRMGFNPDGSVDLYEELDKIGGGATLFHCAILDGVKAAKELARNLCPSDRKLRLLIVQA